MRTRYSDDQQAVREAFAGLFAREATSERVRAAETSAGFDRGLWRKLADAGAPGIALPVEHGGGGASLVDLAVVVHEWGRRIAPVPLVEHAVAARLLASLASPGSGPHPNPPAGPGSGPHPNPPAGPDTGPHPNPPAGPDTGPHPNPQASRSSGAHDDLVGQLASGELIATLSLRPPEPDGIARLVPAGAVADVVVAFHDDALIVDSGEPPGVARPNTADLPLADRDLSDAVALAVGSEARRAWHTARTEWKALMAVAYAGLGGEVLDMGVSYVKQRHQFGVPVGSFQAVQHGLADAATRLEGARLLGYRAACAVERQREDGPRLASMALLFGAESARFASDRALQYHGGYGYSAEYDVQLYYRRAAGWLLQLGEPAAEMARLADTDLGPKAQAA